MTAGI